MMNPTIVVIAENSMWMYMIGHLVVRSQYLLSPRPIPKAGRLHWKSSQTFITSYFYDIKNQGEWKTDFFDK